MTHVMASRSPCCPGKGQVAQGRAITKPSQPAPRCLGQGSCPGQWPAPALAGRSSPYLLRDLVKVDELEML